MEEYKEIYLTSLAHDGRAVGRIATARQGEHSQTQASQENMQGQQVVFVQGALPGQRVRARILKSKKKFAEAVCCDVIEEAPDFVASPCSHAQECGGCPLQSMPYEKQLFWKEGMLKEALQRIGKIQTPPFTRIYPSPGSWAYRNKMEFAVGKDACGELAVGLRAKGSHRIISVQECLLMPSECMDILAKVRKLMAATGLAPWEIVTEEKRSPLQKDLPYDRRMRGKIPVQSRAALKKEDTRGLWRHVVVRHPYCALSEQKNDRGWHVHIITAPTDSKNRHSIARLGQSLLDGAFITGFAHEERASTTLVAQGERCITQLGENILHETLANVSYKLHHNAFFQVNTAAAEYICAEAARMASLTGEEILWDIYCGVGAPGLGIAARAKALYGIESNPQALTMAKENAVRMGFDHCEYMAGNAEEHLDSWPKPHVVLADPPRAGLHPRVVESILKAKPDRIIYISCNPATLARDSALFAVDYTLKEICAVDLFPQTAHVESCALFLRR